MRRDKTGYGFRVLHDSPLVRNGRDWIEMLHAICGDGVPGPALKVVQALRATVSSCIQMIVSFLGARARTSGMSGGERGETGRLNIRGDALHKGIS